MKNLKKKIGISLAALTCVLTFYSKPVCESIFKEDTKKDYEFYFISESDGSAVPVPITNNGFTLGVIKKNTGSHRGDPSIIEVVDSLFAYPECSSYTLPDGRIIKFEFYGSKGSPYTAHFSMDIVKEAELGGQVETVRIRDCHLDGLGKDDLVGYKMENRHAMGYEPKFEFREFDKLSKEAQEKIRKEYNKIVEEAPSRIAEKHRAKELQKLKEKEWKREMFEKNILDILKDGNEKVDHKNRFSCWVIA